jgi:hypothetical protein
LVVMRSLPGHPLDQSQFPSTIFGKI